MLTKLLQVSQSFDGVDEVCFSLWFWIFQQENTT